jgi:hypothetical protein
MQLPRETAIAAKGALLHVGGIASDDLPLPCRIRGSASIYSIPGAIIRRLAIESMVSPERSKESKATSYGPRPRKGSFTLISGYTRIGYSRGSLRAEFVFILHPVAMEPRATERKQMNMSSIRVLSADELRAVSGGSPAAQ